MLFRTASVATTAALSLLLLPHSTTGNEYMSSPRTRNWYAYEEGSDVATPSVSGVPLTEYCFHCLNHKAADEICGIGSIQSYDDWIDFNGDPIPWHSQAVFTEGQTLTVKSTLTSNLRGHMDLFVCADVSSCTQEDFEANPCEFVQDLLYGAPKDETYPERGYYDVSQTDFEFEYRLPMGVIGEQVMMQWRYVTANRCTPPGNFYEDLGLAARGWIGGNHATCIYPLDPTGALGTNKPEQFWNCAEITIVSSTDPPTLPPASTPPTPASTPAPVEITAPTAPTSTPCCTNDFKTCSATLDDRCHASQENCEGPCDKWWLPNGALTGCTARYKTCSSDSECCSPGKCINNIQCLEPQSTLTAPSTPTPTPAPVPPTPTPPPTTYNGIAPTSDLLSSSTCMSSYDALLEMDTLVYEVDNSPYTLFVLAEGAGSEGSVFSEGQGYGVLASAIAIASLNGGENRDNAMERFEGYFNGWKMCINSLPVSSCQSTKYCGG